MSILGDRIKKERKSLGWSREDLAKRLGVSYSAIAMYEQGNREPNNELTIKMCEIFNCSMDYLMGKTTYPTEEFEYIEMLKKASFNKTLFDEYESLKSFGLSYESIDELLKILSTFESNTEILKKSEKFISTYDNINKVVFLDLIKQILKRNEKNVSKIMVDHYSPNYMSQFYMCPVYGRISAGQPNWAVENIEGRFPVPMTGEISNPEECFYLKVNGESMNKVVKNGSYALIHKQDIVEDGEIAVVLVNGYDATLKKFSRQSNFIVLEPISNITDDPNIKTQIYDSKTSIKILGKYIGKFEMN